VRVEGLDQYRRGLRRAGPEYPKRLAKVNKEAGERVARGAQSRYRNRYEQHSGRGVASIRSLAQQAGAKVRIGSARVPYMLGQEFGSNRYRQFAPHVGRAGRFLFPTIREEMPKLVDEYLEELDDIAREAYPRWR
jgi:hypothetical protein